MRKYLFIGLLTASFLGVSEEPPLEFTPLKSLEVTEISTEELQASVKMGYSIIIRIRDDFHYIIKDDVYKDLRTSILSQVVLSYPPERRDYVRSTTNPHLIRALAKAMKGLFACEKIPAAADNQELDAIIETIGTGLQAEDYLEKHFSDKSKLLTHLLEEIQKAKKYIYCK